MNKKFIKIFTSVVTTIVLLANTVVFADNKDNASSSADVDELSASDNYSDLYDIFTLEDNGNGLTITDVADVAGKVIVPEEINGKPVTKIAEGAFGGSSDIEEVYISDSVTEIGATCFAYSTGIKRIKLSKSIKVIPNGCFAHCDSLIGITIPYGVTEVEDNAFASCASLSSVSVPTTVTRISDNAFANSDSVFFYCKLSDEPYAITYAQEKGIGYDNLINVYLNGTEVDFDQAPITDPKRFRTLVPLRSVLEEMGATIEWYNDMGYAGINIGNYRLLIKPGEEFMRVNDKTVFLTSPSIEYNERILLPIRDVVNAVGGKVVWKENSTSVFITYNPQ